MRDLLRMMILFMTGAAFGSFLNCCCGRMMEQESLLTRSRCPSCGHPLKVKDLVPLFSYLFLKGRCRYCLERIDPFCFYAEVAGAILFVLLFLHFGFCRVLFGYLLLAGVMLMISLYDARSMLIPDLAMVLLPFVRIFLFYLTREAIQDLFIQVSDSLFAAFLLYLFVLSFEKIAGKQMMGRGDLLLIFHLGAYLNLRENIVSLFLSCLIALVYVLPQIKKRQDGRFPFAPAICLAYLTVILYGKTII